MDVTGTLVHILPLQTGQGKNGAWKKQDFVIEMPGSFPKKACFSAWGDKIDSSKLVIGQMLKVSFDVESREYNGRWYTDLKAYSLQSAGETGQRNMPPPPPVHESVIIDQVVDDLPF
jgi:hypothetical protein